MKFSTVFNEIPFEIEVLPDQNYSPLATEQTDEEEIELLKSQELGYFQIIISMATDLPITFYYSGIILALDDEQREIELEEFLFEGEVLQEIYNKKAQ